MPRRGDEDSSERVKPVPAPSLLSRAEQCDGGAPQDAVEAVEGEHAAAAQRVLGATRRGP